MRVFLTGSYKPPREFNWGVGVILLVLTMLLPERGAIAQPDLVMVADETLLSDPAALPLAGCGAQCTLVINSPKTAEVLRSTEAFHLSDVGPLLCADFTALALDATHTVASLSTALGVAAGRLLGLSLADCLAGLEDELGIRSVWREFSILIDEVAAIAQDGG